MKFTISRDALIKPLNLVAGVVERRQPWLRRLMIAALGLVVLQGVVGGIGVRLDLPHVTSIAHGVLAHRALAPLGVLAKRAIHDIADCVVLS